MKYIPAKSIIIKSRLPDTDYVVNPYIGCSFGCSYCYASFMGKQVGESIGNWGSYVYVKQDCVEIFSKELFSFVKKGANSSILFSSVTDPYQPIESKFLLTKQMLEICVSYHYEGEISMKELWRRIAMMRGFLGRKSEGIMSS